MPIIVHTSETPGNAMTRESLIYANIQQALDALEGVERDRRPFAPPVATRPGTRTVRPDATTIALGRPAHVALADHLKRTAFAGGDDTLDEADLGRLVWASVNTTRLVAIGESAWRASQLLPFAERRAYDVPPLRMTRACDHRRFAEAPAVLVVDHATSPREADRVADVLGRDGYEVQRTGRRDDEGSAEKMLVDDAWSSAAAIHVHVGLHGLKARELRLVDTWRSGRLAITLTPGADAGADSLMVETEVNGFLCRDAESVAGACRELRADGVLRAKMLQAGAGSVAQISRQWQAIATDLAA